MAWAIHHAYQQLNDQAGEDKGRLDNLATAAAGALQHRFSMIFERDLEDVTDELWLVGMVALMEPGTSTRDWFRSRRDVVRWPRSHLLGAFVNVGTSYGSGPPESILGSYSGNHFEALVGRDQVVPAFWEAGGPLPSTSLDESDISLENRVRRARAELQVVIRERPPSGS